jgi:hypothetical protein
MRTPIALFSTLFAVCFSTSLARADWMPILRGPFLRVVAAGHRAAALRDQDVLVLHEDGRVLARLAGRRTAGKEVGPSPFAQVAERTLDRLEIPEIDRDTDFTDDLVDEESRLSERRGWRGGRTSKLPSPADVPPALAASVDDIWIANHRGMFRVSDDGSAVLAFGQPWTGTHIAAAQDSIVVVKGDAAVLLSMDADPRPVRLPLAPEALAISPSGHLMAWSAGSSIHLVRGAKDMALEAPAKVSHLAFCGDTAVALTASHLLAIAPDGRGETRAIPTDVQKLVCAPDQRLPWLAVGNGLWISSDQGRRWSAVPVPDGRTIFDVALSASHVWLATSDGLYVSVDAAASGDVRTALVRRSGPRALSWLAWLAPKVSVRAAATFAPAGRRLEGFAFAAFPLGSSAIPATVTVSEETIPIPEPPHPAPAVELRDDDSACLAAARRKAVEAAMAEPERARSYVTRAGRAAWLPELRVLVSRRYGRSESMDVGSSSTGLASPLGIDTVNDIRYEARATWDLGRLVFSADELSAQAQALHMAELRRDIETTVNRLYFERRRLIVAPAGDRGVRARELEAELDAMSAGAFGTCVSERSVAAR